MTSGGSATDPRAAHAARTAGLLLLGRDGHESGASIAKMPTGIPGFDHVAMGGLPRGRATVLAGQAGSSKTVFAGQFLAEGVRAGQAGVFVTLEEPAADLRANLSTLGFDVCGWEQDDLWRFVDASPVVRSTAGVAQYSLETLAAQIGHAVDATGATRLVLDSLNAVLTLHEDVAVARQLLRSLISMLRGMGLTVVLTVETPGDPGGTLSRYGIEEFVADSVVLLRNVREGTFRRRTLEVLKMRGAMHHKGEVAFTVVPGQGMVVLPVREPEQEANLDDVRLSTGNADLDAMTNGGLFRGSCTLVSGPSGTGKTLLTTQFLAAAGGTGEKTILFSYEETREQVLRNARGWGQDLEAQERDGQLLIVALYPEAASLDDHLVEVRSAVARFGPARVAVDSLSALERLGSPASYREFVIGLTSYVKEKGVATLLTASAPDLAGGDSATQSHISGLIDTIVLLRYVEVGSTVRRAVAVLKMRGSRHDSTIREFTVGDTGMVMGAPFTSATGILGRVPTA